jgi:hypothetical protein
MILDDPEFNIVVDKVRVEWEKNYPCNMDDYEDSREFFEIMVHSVLSHIDFSSQEGSYNVD